MGIDERKLQAARRAIEAGTLAAALPTGDQFDFSDDRFRGAYIWRIRVAMAKELGDFPELGAYTDTRLELHKEIAREDAFWIGVMDRSLGGALVKKSRIPFSQVNIVASGGKKLSA